LKFTDNIAHRAVTENKVIVSGYAKGVDQQALDSAIKYGGKSIVVLPQGITTFSSGFKSLYHYIIEGRVLILSTFFPKSGWSRDLAMARNPIIYGLASEIYVAESNNKGGTWSGVMDGLRKKRIIYVRQSNADENNANMDLIQAGAVPITFNGIPYTMEENETTFARESPVAYNSIEERIINILSKQEVSSKYIIDNLSLNWSVTKMTNYLKKLNDIIVIKSSKPHKYTLNRKSEPTLF